MEVVAHVLPAWHLQIQVLQSTRLDFAEEHARHEVRVANGMINPRDALVDQHLQLAPLSSPRTEKIFDKEKMALKPELFEIRRESVEILLRESISAQAPFIRSAVREPTGGSTYKVDSRTP